MTTTKKKKTISLNQIIYNVPNNKTKLTKHKKTKPNRNKTRTRTPFYFVPDLFG